MVYKLCLLEAVKNTSRHREPTAEALGSCGVLDLCCVAFAFLTVGQWKR